MTTAGRHENAHHAQRQSDARARARDLDPDLDLDPELELESDLDPDPDLDPDLDLDLDLEPDVRPAPLGSLRAAATDVVAALGRGKGTPLLRIRR